MKPRGCRPARLPMDQPGNASCPLSCQSLVIRSQSLAHLWPISNRASTFNGIRMPEPGSALSSVLGVRAGAGDAEPLNVTVCFINIVHRVLSLRRRSPLQGTERIKLNMVKSCISHPMAIGHPCAARACSRTNLGKGITTENKRRDNGSRRTCPVC